MREGGVKATNTHVNTQLNPQILGRRQGSISGPISGTSFITGVLIKPCQHSLIPTHGDWDMCVCVSLSVCDILENSVLGTYRKGQRAVDH